MKIIPAILPSSFRAIDYGVQKVADIVDTVQIDFVDGFFAPNRTWWFNRKDEHMRDALLNESVGMPEWEHMNYEFDLMIKDPLQHMDTFIALGPSKIIFHVEGLNAEEMLAYFEHLPLVIKENITFGIALGNDTDPATLAPYMPYITSIQCMGIAEVGYQGRPFDTRVLDQIQKVKELYPDKTITVDGAVTAQTIGQLATQGATEFVVGSAIFQSSDPRGTIEELLTLCTSSHHEN